MVKSNNFSVAIRGVAGAHVYTVYLDGEPLAIMEDRQTQVTYMHTDRVVSGSEVVVVPLRQGPFYRTQQLEGWVIFLTPLWSEMSMSKSFFSKHKCTF